MRRASTIAVALVMLVGAGCAGPGVVRDLPGPRFPATPQPDIRKPPVVIHQPRPKPQPRPQPTLRRIGAVTIVVDAGHGGRDPGAQGVSAAAEKTVNLNIAMQLARRLEQAGAEVITTRDSDRFISLDGRAAMAERVGADLFVSIHADAAQRAGASGATIYIARNASSRSQQAAQAIDAALRRAGIKSRGIQRAGFRVLVGHSRPAVLIETGFLTNPGDAQRLNTASYQFRMAATIADGIADHFGR